MGCKHIPTTEGSLEGKCKIRNGKKKGKVVPALNQAPRHADVLVERKYNTIILDLVTSWR
jgi:hypothetical protein